MKRKILTAAAALLLGTTFLWAEANTTGEQKSTKTSTNIKYSKIEMIFVSQSGCLSCEKIKEYMQYGEIKKLLAEHFIITKKDFSKARSLPNNLEQPMGTPTIYFIDENGEEIIDTMVGGKSEENFMDILQEAVAANQH